MVKRYICPGDIHGCLAEFRLLLDKVNYDPANDVVCCVGDLVDRGSDSPGVVRFCIENGFRSVMGNHDAKLVRRWRHVLKHRANSSYKIPMNHSDDQMKTINELTNREMGWIADLPFYIELPEFKAVVIHAGLMPGVPLHHQTKEILSMLRYMNKDTHRMLSLQYPDFSVPPDSVFWAEVYDGQPDVIFGHEVVSLCDIKTWERPEFGKCFGIDTGCAFGGRLSCIVLDTEKPLEREIVQVQALKEYCAASKRY